MAEIIKDKQCPVNTVQAQNLCLVLVQVLIDCRDPQIPDCFTD